MVECDFEEYFDQQVKELESAAEKNSQRAPQIALDELAPPSSSGNRLDEPPPPTPGLAPGKPDLISGRFYQMLTPHPSAGQVKKQQSNGDSTDVSPIPTPDTSRPSTPAGHILGAKSGPKGGSSRRARKAISTPANASSGDEKKARSKKDTGKKMRRWDDSGMVDEEDGTILDYSAQTPSEKGTANGGISAPMEPIDSESHGIRTGKGQFVLKDLDIEVHSILQGANEKKSNLAPLEGGVVESSLGAISGLFRKFIGGKVLTNEDLVKSMRGMEEHLLNKNVAREAAVRLCEGVERELIGVKTGSFESKPALLQELPPGISFLILQQVSKQQSGPQWNPLYAKSSPQQHPSTSSAPSPP